MKTLLIEPETAVADRIISILKQKKCEITLAPTETSGKEYALTGFYDLIVLDSDYTNDNGFHLSREFRLSHLHTPILLLAPEVMVEDRIHALNSGVDYCLPKSFDSRELLAFLDVLARRKQEQDTLLCFGNTVLDLTSDALLCEDAEVHLSEKEFQLAHLLFQSGSRNLSKETILSRVWGCDSCAIDNNVEVYIRFLRKKFTLIHSNVRIATIRRVGYHLEVFSEKH